MDLQEKAIATISDVPKREVELFGGEYKGFLSGQENNLTVSVTQLVRDDKGEPVKISDPHFEFDKENLKYSVELPVGYKRSALQTSLVLDSSNRPISREEYVNSGHYFKGAGLYESGVLAMKAGSLYEITTRNFAERTNSGLSTNEVSKIYRKYEIDSKKGLPIFIESLSLNPDGTVTYTKLKEVRSMLRVKPRIPDDDELVVEDKTGSVLGYCYYGFNFVLNNGALFKEGAEIRVFTRKPSDIVSVGQQMKSDPSFVRKQDDIPYYTLLPNPYHLDELMARVKELHSLLVS